MISSKSENETVKAYSCEIGSCSQTDGKMQMPTVRLALTVLAVGFGTSFQYYSNSVVNNAVDVSKRWINTTRINDGQSALDESSFVRAWSLATTLLQLGAVMSSFVTQAAAERLGRRKSLMVTSCISALAALLTVWSILWSNYEAFLIGRFVYGLGLGCGVGLASLFLCEIAPSSLRGTCCAVQQLFVGLGNLTALLVTVPQLLGNERLLWLAFGLPLFPSLIQLLVLSLSHDSPRHLLLSRGDQPAASRAARFYLGSSAACGSELIQLEVIQRVSMGELFRNVQCRRMLLIALAVTFGIQFSGIGPIMVFSKTMLTDAGVDDFTSRWATVGLGFCNFLAPLPAMAMMQRVGRRPMLLSGFTVCAFCLTTISVLVHFANHYESKTVLLAAVPCLYVYQIGFSLAASVGWTFPAELFSQRHRSAALTVVCFFLWTFQAIAVYTYLPVKERFGVAKSFLPYICSLLFDGFLLYRYMPETRCRSLEANVTVEKLPLVNDHCKSSSENNLFQSA